MATQVAAPQTGPAPAPEAKWRPRVSLRSGMPKEGEPPCVFGYVYVGRELGGTAGDTRTRLGFSTDDRSEYVRLWPTRGYPEPKPSEVEEAIGLLRGFIATTGLPLKVWLPWG